MLTTTTTLEMTKMRDVHLGRNRNEIVIHEVTKAMPRDQIGALTQINSHVGVTVFFSPSDGQMAIGRKAAP